MSIVDDIIKDCRSYCRWRWMEWGRVHSVVCSGTSCNYVPANTSYYWRSADTQCDRRHRSSLNTPQTPRINDKWTVNELLPYDDRTCNLDWKCRKISSIVPAFSALSVWNSLYRLLLSYQYKISLSEHNLKQSRRSSLKPFISMAEADFAGTCTNSLIHTDS